MGPIWGRQDPGGPHVGPMNIVIWDVFHEISVHSLTLSKCTMVGPGYTGMPLECHWLTQCTLGYHWLTRRILTRYTGTPLEKLIWNYPTLECHWRDSDYCSLHWNTTGGTNSPRTPRHIWLSRVAFLTVWNDEMAGHQTASGQVSVNSAFTWSILLCNAYQFCSSNVWVFQHPSVHAFHMSTIIVFVYLRLQFKWTPFSSTSYRHTSWIHKGLHAGNWTDLLRYTPDAVDTLGYHWTTSELHRLMLSPSGLPVTIQW